MPSNPWPAAWEPGTYRGHSVEPPLRQHVGGEGPPGWELAGTEQKMLVQQKRITYQGFGEQGPVRSGHIKRLAKY
ncbi:hypothetical protein NDU88_006671 [Pleurodeles waltl]|uniref:Uncharacterized protein n=1 Tax=Pleurodeles waltl TaxID=8319 RepID=A0AAV7N3Q1_PLEWA|nr:hypothetical protein NDU88_006671 [Pleurodeles waltl]